jgi:hypothetical protein
MVIDVSHLNAAGVADVARLDVAPIVASHCACHALCPSSRNLTDEQLRAIAASDGIVGIVFAVAFLRADGHDDADTPLSTLVAHVRHAVDVVGVDHVGLGSDFDGATVPRAIGDVAGLPAVLDALRDDGFAPAEVEAIAWGSWRRVLGRAYRATGGCSQARRARSNAFQSIGGGALGPRPPPPPPPPPSSPPSSPPRVPRTSHAARHEVSMPATMIRAPGSSSPTRTTAAAPAR